MSELSEVLRSCASPVDLIALTGEEPSDLTSPMIVTILRAMYGVSPTKADRARWKLVSSEAWPTRRARKTSVCVGRRGLKTTGILVWALLFEALCRSSFYARFALPGARLRFPIVAPFIAQAAEAIAALKGALAMLAPIGVAADVRDENGSPSIVIRNPVGRCEVIINVFSASEFSAVGFTVPFWCADEAARFPSSGPSSLRAVARALDPAGSTFADPGCEAGSLWCSNKAAPEGAFYEAVQGEPKPGARVIRAASWTTNPRMTRAHCLELCDGDERELSVTYDGESPLWGYDGESYIPTANIAIGDEFCGLGPRDGYFCVGLDVGQMVDSSAIVVVSAADTEIPGASPVRHVVVEAVESILSAKASKGAPPSIEMIVGRACEVATVWGDAPITCDFFNGVEVRRVLEKRGWSEYTGDYFPPARHYVIAGMGPQAQHPRWGLLRSLSSGGRLHVPESGRELVQQLGQLTATMLAGGSLKVEGKRDDLADALALAASIAMKLPPTLSAGGSEIVCVDEGWSYDRARRREAFTLPKYERVFGDGRTEPCEMPSWAPRFDDYAKQMISEGRYTPEILRWQESQRRANAGTPDASDLVIKVQH